MTCVCPPSGPACPATPSSAHTPPGSAMGLVLCPAALTLLCDLFFFFIGGGYTERQRRGTQPNGGHTNTSMQPHIHESGGRSQAPKTSARQVQGKGEGDKGDRRKQGAEAAKGTRIKDKGMGPERRPRREERGGGQKGKRTRADQGIAPARSARTRAGGWRRMRQSARRPTAGPKQKPPHPPPTQPYPESPPPARPSTACLGPRPREARAQPDPPQTPPRPPPPRPLAPPEPEAAPPRGADALARAAAAAAPADASSSSRHPPRPCWCGWRRG